MGLSSKPKYWLIEAYVFDLMLVWNTREHIHAVHIMWISQIRYHTMNPMLKVSYFLPIITRRA